MRTHLLPAALLAAALACAGGPRAAPKPAAPAVPSSRTLAAADGGAIAFDVPAGWEVREGEAGEERRTVELGPADRSFVALLTVFPVRRASPDEDPLDTAQLYASLARRSALPGAVEDEVPLQELAGPAARGFWFEATDASMEREPADEPGRGGDPRGSAARGGGAGPPRNDDEYRHLVQGAVVVEDVLLAFTLLDNGDGPQRRALLELVRGARPAGAAAGGAPDDPLARTLVPDPGASTVPYVARDRGGRVSVLVDLPGFRMFRPRASAAGDALAVVGEAPASGIVASLILKDAPGLDARACRDRDLAELRRAVPGITAVAAADVAGQARLAYEVPAGQGAPAAQRHAHAFLAREGVCVNLHLSKAEPAPGDAERLEAILASLRFDEPM